MTTFHYNLVRGNRWLSQTFLFVKPNFDWAGVSFSSMFRQFPEGEILAVPTVNVVQDVSQAVKVQLVLEGVATKFFPIGRVYGDLRLYRAAALYGPYTPFSFILNVGQAITV